MRTGTRGSLALVAIALILALGVDAAFASGAAHGEEHGPTGAQWFILLCTIINFSIFAFAMVRFTKAPLADYLKQRREEVVEAMSAAARAKAEADQLKAEFEAKAAALDQTRAEMIEEIKGIAAKDRERIMSEAAETAERMQKDAELRAENEVAAARRELRAEAARLATELAEKQVRAQLDAGGRKALLDDFLEGVS